jgi:hypothetical protein
MTVTDPSIVAGETIYALTSTGLVAVGHATQNGTATITFTTDPLFVVATLTAKHVSVKDHSSVTILGDDQQARAGAKITYRLTKHGKVLHKVAWKLARSHRFQWTTADLTRGNYVATFKIAGKTIKTTTITVG